MNKWYQEIIVEHKELDNKMYHCFDDENFKKLTDERNEQLKEIERLTISLQAQEELTMNWYNKVKKATEYIEEHIRIDDEYPDYMEMLLEEYKELLGILDKESE